MKSLQQSHISLFMTRPVHGVFPLLFGSWGIAALLSILSGFLLQGVIMYSTLISIGIAFLALLYAFFIYQMTTRVQGPMVDCYLFLFAFAIRLVTIYALSEVLLWDYGAPYFGMKDDLEYHHLALGVAQDLPRGEYFNILAEIGPYYVGYPYFCGLLYHYIYPSTYTARIVNALFGSIIVVLLYRITRYVFSDKKIAIWVGAICAVMPSAVLYSSVQLKDIPLSFMIFSVLLCFFRIVSNKNRVTDYVIFTFCLLASLVFRPAMPILLLFLMWCVSIASLNVNRRSLIVTTSMFIIFIAGWYYAGQSLLQSSELNPAGYIENRFENAQTVPEDSALNQSGSLFSTLMAFPAFAIGSPFVPTFLSVDLPLEDPIPSKMRFDIYNKPSTLMLVILSPFLFVGLLKSILEFRSNRYLMTLAGFWLLHKLMLANSAFILNTRQSTPSIIVGIPFILIGLHAFNNPFYRKITIAAFVINYIILLAFNYVRLSARGLI